MTLSYELMLSPGWLLLLLIVPGLVILIAVVLAFLFHKPGGTEGDARQFKDGAAHRADLNANREDASARFRR